MATSSNLTQALFRIDPTEALVEYVQVVKPYHTKILEVLVEYIYTEQINASVTERMSWVLDLQRPDGDVSYSCGYGYRWSPSQTWDPSKMAFTPPESVPIAKIIKASGEDDTIVNSFLVTSALYSPGYTPGTSHECLVINTQSNQLAFVTPYPIVGVNVSTKTWTVSGPVTLGVGDIIYVNSNSNSNANGKYTVALSTIPGGTTDITVNESIYPLATVSGTVNVPLLFDDIPYWPSGVKVQLSSTGTIPTPLSPSTTYYFIPTANVGVFNLATKRYPQQFGDYVDLTSLGTGTLSILRTEPFVPGDVVTVSGSYVSSNDGNYVISSIEPEGVNFRVKVIQKVPRTTPVFVTPYDGVMTFNLGSYDSDYCSVASAPDVFVGAYIHESLKFTFELAPQDLIGVQAIENQSTAGYGYVPYDSPYDDFVDDFPPFTTITQLRGSDGTHMVLPTGYDTQFFDVGGIDETLKLVSENYGRTI